MKYKSFFKKLNFKEPSNIILYGVGAVAILFILYWIIRVLMILMLVAVVGYCLYLLVWRKENGHKQKEQGNRK